MVFLDIRVEKTERAIKQAFLELRANSALEKIKVKDLCERACINKSTFYAHYPDIYALSEAMEQELLETILDSVSENLPSDVNERTERFALELFRAFVANQDAVNILFSGARQGLFANRIEQSLREHLTEADPTFAADPTRGIMLSFCVQGCYYAFANNSSAMDEARLVRLLAAIARAAHSVEQ